MDMFHKKQLKYMNNLSEIKFYKVNEPFGQFSNFSPHSIYLDDKVWKTVEHYFQANKFIDQEIQERLRRIDSPMKAAEFGRDRTNTIRSDWDNIKEDVMYRAVKTKFLQHINLQKLIIETGDAVLIEHTKNDSYWGDGGNGSGKNKLGQILMKIREELKYLKYDINIILPLWIAYPSIDKEDMFWRMGGGESYLMKWYDSFVNTDQVAYREKFPEPENWQGFYDS